MPFPFFSCFSSLICFVILSQNIKCSVSRYNLCSKFSSRFYCNVIHTYTHTHTHTHIYIYIYTYTHTKYLRLSKRFCCAFASSCMWRRVTVYFHTLQETWSILIHMSSPEDKNLWTNALSFLSTALMSKIVIDCWMRKIIKWNYKFVNL